MPRSIFSGFEILSGHEQRLPCGSVHAIDDSEDRVHAMSALAAGESPRRVLRVSWGPCGFAVSRKSSTRGLEQGFTLVIGARSRFCNRPFLARCAGQAIDVVSFFR
jgi:hypothetical protein